MRVDGGMVVNELLMQFQADILNREVVRPVVQETTALGRGICGGACGGILFRHRRAAREVESRTACGSRR